ncbi:uncharacterized protein LOC129003784 [Macrosteles quadrilineatus]|uniref:uncharacterized protein LOC129003784 n=1 Tax=Macrosteles quadrilineatus TaxID=74068 RepID=UPI0023E1E8DB|nr:uncharacterized protein LOC129003784 [Macrosteles quadrilineatus]
MAKSLEIIKCTFFVISSIVSSTIFFGLILEETFREYEIDNDYNTNIKERISQAKSSFPVISRVKLPNHDQEDPELVKDLNSKILPPCSSSKEYKLYQNERGGIGKFEHIRKLTSTKAERFFLECGARDGVSLSNTLYLEKNLFWKGLLVEADPAHFENIISVHRKAWIAPVCMSLNTSAYVAHFNSSLSFEGKILTNETKDDMVQVVCYPFYTFILAMNIKKIDYFSLSVAGHEMEILETIPFDRVDIGFVSVNVSYSRGGSRGVTNFMTRHGYELVKEFPPSELLFVHIDEDYW